MFLPTQLSKNQQLVLSASPSFIAKKYQKVGQVDIYGEKKASGCGPIIEFVVHVIVVLAVFGKLSRRFVAMNMQLAPRHQRLAMPNTCSLERNAVSCAREVGDATNHKERSSFMGLLQNPTMLIAPFAVAASLWLPHPATAANTQEAPVDDATPAAGKPIKFSAGTQAMKYSMENDFHVGVAVSRGTATKHSAAEIAAYIERNFKNKGITAKVFTEEYNTPGSVVTFTVGGVESELYHFGNMKEGFDETVDLVRALLHRAMNPVLAQN